MLVYNKLALIDSLRSFFLSALVPLTEVVFMLILIHEMNGTLWQKTILGVLLKSGFLLSLPLSLWALRKKFMLPDVLTAFNLVGIGALALTLWVRAPLPFIALACLISYPHDMIHPFLAEFYSRYPKVSRGRRFALTLVALLVGSIFFSYVARQALARYDESLFSGYNVVVGITIGSLIVSTFFARRLPRLRSKSDKALLTMKEAFAILKRDRLFLIVLISWMLLGIANLWILPYRTNYLSEDVFGFAYSEERILFLLVALPFAFQLLMTFPMSYVFDKIPFLKLRILINVLLIIYFLMFFFTDHYSVLVASMFFLGAGRAGGSLCWKLWVNQMVPPAKVSAYMAIHSGATGVRMLLSPVFGLWALYMFGPMVCGLISVALMVLSIVLLLPQLKGASALQRY